jgi:hypothetical protein
MVVRDKKTMPGRDVLARSYRSEFFIDLQGRFRGVGNRNIALAVTDVGYVHVGVIDRMAPNEDLSDRAVIVRLQPQRISQLALAALGYHLADLDPTLIIVVADLPMPLCKSFTGYLTAMKMIAQLTQSADLALASPPMAVRTI